MEQKNNEITKTESLPSVFEGKENWELTQRMAKALSESSLVPIQYSKNIPNTIIAIEMANRMGASPLMVMQHLHIVHGKPSWSSTFIISAINSCGRFEPLRYVLENEGDPDKMRCKCVAVDKRSKKELHGPWVSMKMAKDEGWVQKNGSKWKTMPELMIRYRAAAFFGRLFAPEITMGMQAVEEVQDVVYEEIKEEKRNENRLLFDDENNKTSK